MKQLHVFPSCSTNVIVFEYANVSGHKHILMHQQYSYKLVPIPRNRQFIFMLNTEIHYRYMPNIRCTNGVDSDTKYAN